MCIPCGSLPGPKNTVKNDAFRSLISSNPALGSLARSRSVLMLQGPVGPFFDRLTHWLRAQGVAQINRVVFSGGDRWDCKALEPVLFQQGLDAWPMFLQNLLLNFQVDCLVLFGQARPHHAKAMVLASLLGVKVVVLEEGYFRTGFITMEQGGVNGYSSTLDLYEWQPAALALNAQPVPRESIRMGWYSAVHYTCMALLGRGFTSYVHHKPTSVPQHAKYFIGSWAKKLLRHFPDHLRARFLEGHAYFLVPLQFDLDAQISVHSPFSQNTEFILQVLRSFAEYAPKDNLLVFKQHPMSRGTDGHWPLIKAVAAELGILQRLRFFTEGRNQRLVQQATGVVTINSTMGLLALQAATPLCVMGSAVYKNFPGVFQDGLDRFWRAAPLERGYNAAKDLQSLKHLTQLPGSLYAPRSEALAWQLPS